MNYHVWCVFTVVFTACSLRVHSAFAVTQQKARKRAFERPGRSRVGPFPSPFELNAVESSSDQLSPARTPVAAQLCTAQPWADRGCRHPRLALAGPPSLSYIDVHVCICLCVYVDACARAHICRRVYTRAYPRVCVRMFVGMYA